MAQVKAHVRKTKKGQSMVRAHGRTKPMARKAKVAVHKIPVFKFDNEWDFEKARLLLEMQGLDGKTLTVDERNRYEQMVTDFLWKRLHSEVPDIENFLNGKSGGFNKAELRHHDTPIISIHGSFYMQLISENSRRNWIWESVELTPLGFIFNNDRNNYFSHQVAKEMKEAIPDTKIGGLVRMKKLVKSLKLEDYEKQDLLDQLENKLRELR